MRLINQVQLDIDGRSVHIDPTVQVSQRDIIKRLADGTEILYGKETVYRCKLLSHCDISPNAKANLYTQGKEFDGGYFQVSIDSNSIIRLTKVVPA